MKGRGNLKFGNISEIISIFKFLYHLLPFKIGSKIIFVTSHFQHQHTRFNDFRIFQIFINQKYFFAKKTYPI